MAAGPPAGAEVKKLLVAGCKPVGNRGGTAYQHTFHIPDQGLACRDALHLPNPVPKCSYMISLTSNLLGTKRAGERGQISIFFASSLIVLISIIAFVINIGLFVKAKINLQNATDASAYAGAAVQARMLTRIGYMNWELRNNYKEWMFKYYVLGNLNINDVRATPGSGNVSYRMEPDPNINDGTGVDVYNFPSVCLHYAGVPTNVCRRYAIPGIPRFEPTNLVGIDETTSSFIDAIVKEKSSDCSKRTQLNFNVTNLWAYNLRDGAANSAFADAPQVAVDRVGAWPKAVELAIRTRALEFAMNRPPTVLCGDPSLGSPGCQNAETLIAQNHYGNERPAKAYWSGYRNLTNEGSNRNEEMKASFTLTELAPQSVSFPDNSLSTMLGGPKGKRPKQYVDLKIQLVNYATFFTALIARDDVLNAAGQVVKAEGACDVSKIAIPVPGFPMGFYKNPEVVTYYAVKGEASFQGLFNPFSTPSTKLTAYAAAKPMGGRIGPALFRAGSGSDETAMSTRTTANNRRSTPYLSGLNLANVKRKGTNTPVPIGGFAPGMPIPINRGPTQEERFWIADPTDQIGGWVSGPGIVFGVPNLVYDFNPGGITDPNSYISAVPTNIIIPNPEGVSDDAYSAGLYKGEQLTMFRANLEGVDNVEQITKSIYNVRAPTAYEAANYTIPIPYDLGLQPAGGSGNFLDTFGFVVGEKTSEGSGIERYQGKIYAPLFSQSNEDALFANAAEVGAEIKNFMNVQTSAMEKYRNSMNLVAKTIFDDDPVKYRDAAERISDFPFNLNPTDAGAKPTCKSIAGTFLAFYFGDSNTLGNTTGTLCPLSLTESIDAFYNSSNLGFDAHTHTIEYSYREDHPRSDIIKWDKLLTSYMPGPMRGATEDGLFSTPYSGEQETMRRTGYSTKLVTLKSLTSSGHYGAGSGANAAIYSEGLFTPLGEDVRQNNFRNALELSALGVPTTVNH